MIPGKPKPISGEPNEEFTRPLIGYRKYGKSLAEGENQRGLKGQTGVVLRPVPWHLFIVEEENLMRKEKRKEKKQKRAKKTSEPRNQ